MKLAKGAEKENKAMTENAIFPDAHKFTVWTFLGQIAIGHCLSN
jgi:hypothetical protein